MKAGRFHRVEHWPDDIVFRAPKMVLLRLSDNERSGLLWQSEIAHEYGYKTECVATARLGYVELTTRLRDALDDPICRGGVHIRLSERSPKDSWNGHHEGFRCYTAEQVLQVLSDSERVYEDLERDKSDGIATHLALREWFHIEPYDEWRVFLSEDGRVTGITQSDPDEDYVALGVYDDDFLVTRKTAICALADKLVLGDEYLPCTLDVAFQPSCLLPLIIEINPYPDPELPILVDPGAFSVPGDSFLFEPLPLDFVPEIRTQHPPEQQRRLVREREREVLLSQVRAATGKTA